MTQNAQKPQKAAEDTAGTLGGARDFDGERPREALRRRGGTTMTRMTPERPDPALQ